MATRLVVLLLLLASPAAAQPLVSNTAESTDGQNFAVLSQWFAAPFVTDAAPRELTAVTVEIDPFQFPQNTVPFARIYADDGSGFPGAWIADLVNPPGLTASDPPGLYTFAAAAPVELAASTRYFVSLGSQIGGPGEPDQRANWAYTLSTASSGAGAMPGGSFFSSNQGASWTNPNPTRNPKFEVEASPPAVPSLGASGLLGMTLMLAAAGTRALRSRGRR